MLHNRCPSLSVVIGTFNRVGQLSRCIDGFIRQTRSRYVIYVTDTGSTDGTLEYLTRVASDQICPVSEGHRVGQALTYNAVFDLIDTPLVCRFSDDNKVIGQGLDRVLEFAPAESQIGLVALKTRGYVPKRLRPQRLPLDPTVT